MRQRQARFVVTVLKVFGQAQNFKKDGDPVAFLNIAHGVIKRPLAISATVWESEESDVMGSSSWKDS